MKFLDIINEQGDDIQNMMLNDLNIGKSVNRKKIITKQNNTSTPEKQNIQSNSKLDAILICGLTHRNGDLSVNQQVETLKNSSGLNNIIGIGHERSNINKIKETIESHPNLPIVLFSAGCDRADVVLSCNGVNVNKVFLIQPWSPDKDRIEFFNKLGMPKNHIYVGSTRGTGFGISGATPCPTEMSHWKSLPSIGGMVLKTK